MALFLDPYETAEAPLRAKKQQLLDELASVDAALVGIARAREMSGHFVLPTKSETKPKPKAKRQKTAIEKTGRYHGQSIMDAAFNVINEQTPKHALSCREIENVLIAANFKIAHNRPSHAIHSQLRRRTEKRGDVLIVGVGKWGLRKWYTDLEIKQIEANLGGMGGRDREAHIARTRVGMATAQSRGVVLGAKPKIDDAMKARIQQMAARKGSEKMTLQQIADAENIALSSIFSVFKGGRKTILAWKPARSEERATDLLTPVAGNA